MIDIKNDKDFSVRVDFTRILETIAASIYDNQYAFLRENVQNAIDALRIQAVRENLPFDNPKYRIDIIIEGNKCIIQDNGIGMTREGLENNFWTMGASGKNTPEAREAGCIGTFGIGGFANFGVCNKLEVVSRTQNCTVTHHTALSKDSFKQNNYHLPTVEYTETDELSSHGTIIIGTALTPFDPEGLKNYLKQFVKYVLEPIYIQNILISQEKLAPPFEKAKQLTALTTAGDANLSIKFELFVDNGNTLIAKIDSLTIDNTLYKCSSYAKLIHGEFNIYKRGFKLCAISVPSRIGVSGSLDTDALRPTAGRDSLDGKSHAYVTKIFQIIESFVRPLILQDKELLASHIRLIPDFISQGMLEHLGLLDVQTLNNRHLSLSEVRTSHEKGERVFYSLSRKNSAAAEVLQARGNIIIAVSSTHPRHSAEINYLKNFCKAVEFDSLIECIEVYEQLDSFERAVIAELDVAIRKLFNPTPYIFIACRLTLDVPIYWSNKKEKNSTVVYIDTRHGEFKKLRPLGYSALFWSMIEAFCREYLGETLKRQSPKFFGTGAINLDAFSKTHAELWELLSSDIVESLIIDPNKKTMRPHNLSRTQLISNHEITHLTISKNIPPADSLEDNEQAKKLLHIIDQTGSMGLSGYYLRIPTSATQAFGELIRTFPTFAVVWFANRITWTCSDTKSTAFLFDITLDRILGEKGKLSHGATSLDNKNIQTYKDEIYFFIPKEFENYLVPFSSDQSIKIEIRHELIDLSGIRSWTSKETEL